MRVSIFGLGYVGAVTAGCLANEGHHVIGVDVNDEKRSMIDNGVSPIAEPGTDALIAKNVEAGRLSTSNDANWAIQNSDVSFICVGTPSTLGGAPDYSYVERVCEDIGKSLATIEHYHVVNIRSTILPGTLRDLIIPTLETASGKTAGVDFGVSHNPEFLREGTAISDFNSPPKTVIGATDERSSNIVMSLYDRLPGPKITTSVGVAEMVKFSDNVWHALKVAFGNEIGTIAKHHGIDSHDVMDVFCQDTKLNISPAYLKPGFAFGGSCLPKDTRGLNHLARQSDITVPIIQSILPSNFNHIERGLQMVMDAGNQTVGVLGCSFKADTDDLRESPIVEIIERLMGKGFDVRVYDPNIQVSSLSGANKSFALERIPHISKILVDDLESLVKHAKTVVVATNDKRFNGVTDLIESDQKLIDFVRINRSSIRGEYNGICW